MSAVSVRTKTVEFEESRKIIEELKEMIG